MRIQAPQGRTAPVKIAIHSPEDTRKGPHILNPEEGTRMTTSVTSAAKAPRRLHGLGRVFQRGRVWWIAYYQRGQETRESSKSERRLDAERLLKHRLQQIGKGHWVNPSTEARLTVGELLEGLELDYRNNGRRSLATLKWRVGPLREAFGEDRAIDLTADRVERYKAARLAAGHAPATINRELAALRRALNLALQQEGLSRMPRITLFAEHNERQGFLEPADFEALVANLPEYLQDSARFAYVTGWRKGEIQSLEWADVNREQHVILLRREHSKNGEPRLLPLIDELERIIARRWQARIVQNTDGASRLCRYVFHREGHRIGDFRKVWRNACEAAGVPSTLFHDLRRSAVRNMTKAGVDQAVAMKITGHKSTSVYRRYRIVDEKDLRDALAKTQASLRQLTRVVLPQRSAGD